MAFLSPLPLEETWTPPPSYLLGGSQLEAEGFEQSTFQLKVFSFHYNSATSEDGEEELGRAALFLLSLWSETREAGGQGSLLIRCLQRLGSVSLLAVLEGRDHFSLSLEEAGTQLGPSCAE